MKRSAISLLEPAWIGLVLAAFYYLLRLPTSGLILPYYDDGETLYHTFNVLSGGVPYRDDFSHHFLGYIIPFLLVSEAIGFSTDVTPVLALVTQTVAGLFVYLTARLFAGRVISLGAALLAVSAREPWIIGFYIYHQLGALSVPMLYLTLRGAAEKRASLFAAAFFLCGLMLVSDQRAVAQAIVPIYGYLQSGVRRSARVALGFFACLAAPAAACLVYLCSNGAFDRFVEQTLVFPASFRSGSKGLLDMAVEAIVLHRYLATETPLLLALGLVGMAVASRRALSAAVEGERRAYRILLAEAVPIAFIAGLGGRDFDYYTILWLPYLALAASLVPAWRGARWRAAHAVFLFLPPLFALLAAARLTSDPHVQGYSGDGVDEVQRFLEEEMRPDDSLFVWGYRLDVYVRLRKRAAYPFSSTLSIHPDRMISDPADRVRHIYPPHEKLFLELLEDRPPSLIVIFERGNEGMLQSPASVALFGRISSDYSEIFRTEKPDLAGERCVFRVYRLGRRP